MIQLQKFDQKESQLQLYIKTVGLYDVYIISLNKKKKTGMNPLSYRGEKQGKKRFTSSFPERFPCWKNNTEIF